MEAAVESLPLPLAPDLAAELTTTAPVTFTAMPVADHLMITEVAATKVQKVYRSYRTRRKLADSAVVAEELWWHATDYARLNHVTISFFQDHKSETPKSRWRRFALIASKVGQGLQEDQNGLKLAFQHWIEAIDPRHRYGHNLHFYYEEWCRSQAGQPFFYWLDIGDGRDVDLKECPRSLLRKECIKYLGPQEREHYEYTIVEGKLVHKQTGQFLDTTQSSDKWIFVMSTIKRLYAGQKQRGLFQHSSFLAGGATIAAGRLTAENGILKSIWAYSGHYRPSKENLKCFVHFLEENGVDVASIADLSSAKEDHDDPEGSKVEKSQVEISTATRNSIWPQSYEIPPNMAKDDTLLDQHPSPKTDNDGDMAHVVHPSQPRYGRTLSGGLRGPRAQVPKTAILDRIRSLNESSNSYQLGHKLSFKWCTGAGPRIGCVKDYPKELQVQAMEMVNLSPRRSAQLCLSPGCVSGLKSG